MKQPFCTPAQALRRVLDAAAALPVPATERVLLDDACGRIAARDLCARMDQPPFDRSPLDGYALHSADTAGAGEKTPVTLPVVMKLYAGLNSTILVICHKHGVLDRRKKLAAEIEKVGVLFESKKVKDAQLPAFITSYMKRKGVDVEPKATSMLADFVGTDLSRLTGELEKLIITLPKGQTRVTPEQIERNIGISKDYNNFELRSAIVEKDILKANKIIKYFEENPKTNPIQMTLSLLFGFFSNLMLAYYAPDKSEQGIATFLGLRSPWQSREYMGAMRRYNGVKTMQIIGEIRYADAKSKGVANSSLSDGDILRELVFKILH